MAWESLRAVCPHVRFLGGHWAAGLPVRQDVALADPAVILPAGIHSETPWLAFGMQQSSGFAASTEVS